MSRYYDTPHGLLPSVTTIIGVRDKSHWKTPWALREMFDYLVEHRDALKPDISDEDFKAILKEAKQAHKLKSDEALDIGSRVHDAIERYLKGEKVDIMPDIDKPFHACLEWLTTNEVEPIELEQTVYTDRYAGTMDMLCRYKGELCVIDFKTSKKMNKKEMGMQICAYADAWEIRSWNDKNGSRDLIKTMGILRLDKETGMPQWWGLSDEEIERYMKAFDYLVEHYWLIDAPKKIKSPVRA